MFNRLALVIGLLAVTGCSEFNLSQKPGDDADVVPDILVTPPSLEFSMLSSGEEEVLPFTVENVGDSDLHVTDINIGTGISFAIVTAEREFTLAPGENRVVDVSFTPLGADANFGQALVFSDDPDTPEAPVDLLGYGAVPELQITPDSYNFGQAFVPCGAEVELELRNVGSEDLVINDLGYISGGELTLDDSGLRPQLPLTLAPDEFTTVVVNYAAIAAGSDTGVLDVFSNDPRGVVTADQNGEGAYESETSESFTEPGIPPVDVMFLIDQSCSMETDNEDDIRDGIPGFLTEMATIADWQLIQVTQENGCANGGVLDTSTPSADTLLISNAFNSTHHIYTEALLQLADIALGKTAPGGCNDGFLRPGALLHIIVASDEDEQSGSPWADWVTSFESYATAPELVKVSSIVDINTSCGDDSGPGGYLEASNDTGGSVLDICSSSWGTQAHRHHLRGLGGHSYLQPRRAGCRRQHRGPGQRRSGHRLDVQRRYQLHHHQRAQRGRG